MSQNAILAPSVVQPSYFNFAALAFAAVEKFYGKAKGIIASMHRSRTLEEIETYCLCIHMCISFPVLGRTKQSEGVFF